MWRHWYVGVGLMLFAGCPKKVAPGEPVRDEPTAVVGDQPVASDHAAGVQDPGLRALLHDHWEAVLEAWPTWASDLGDGRYDDRLGDNTEAAALAWQAKVDAWVERASALDRSQLSESDQLTLDLFLHERRDDVASRVCRYRHWSVMPRGNVLTLANGLPEDLPLPTPEDAENLLSRYAALPDYIDAESANLSIGLAEGLVANAHSVRLVTEQLNTQLNQPAEEWPMWTELSVGEGWPDGFENEWRQRVRNTLEEEVRPALERHRDFLQETILPAARPDDATTLAALPNGAECYEAEVRAFTTLDTTAEEVHQRGLDALEGIHAEFIELGGRLWGVDTTEAVFERLRTDETLYFETRDEVRDKAEEALRRAEAAMPEFFGRLPQTACTVQTIPDYQAPYTTIAYYRPPAPGSRPGTYFVNTWAPETRPRHEAEVLAFHESVPGHHLQIAISQELDAMPEFRKHGGFTAFVEGWALYTERLAEEMGLYTGDTDRLGMLSFDAWRAGRLVVDTGLHHKGWSRQEAIDFLLANTPLAPNNIENEVDRYITWPGQALAYKTGQLELWALRHEAEATLGDRFDVRGFHDVVLEAGAVPLPILRQRVKAWVDRVAAQSHPANPPPP